MKITLIKDWKRAWKFASVQWSAVGLVIMTIHQYSSELWLKLPVDVQTTVPYSTYVPTALFALSIVGRLLVISGSKDDGTE